MNGIPDPASLADKMAIQEQIRSYCRAVDRLDLPLGHAVFHEDSHADYGESYYQGPGRGVVDLICQHHLGLISHSHQVTNVIIDLHDANHAGSEAYVTAKLRQMEGERLMEREFCARYIDLWSKRGGEWAIDRRDCIVDLSASREVTSLGQADNAARDRSDPSYLVLKSY